MQPLVSVITVTKNCGSTIERTLNSIKAIKTPDVQYVIIDGCSEDETLSIIDRYKDVVDILICEKDSGIYNAMNKGADMASGQYILFLNGDDCVLVDGFNNAKRILSEEQPEILSCRSEEFSQEGMKIGTINPSLWKLFLFNTMPHLSTFVLGTLQKEYKFREQFRIAADYDLFLRMRMKGHHFRVADLLTATHYRGGYSNNLGKVIAETRLIRRESMGLFLYSISRILELSNQLVNLLLSKNRKI